MKELMDLQDVEVEHWPRKRGGGQQAGPYGAAVIARHKPTGIAVIVGEDDDRRSRLNNRRVALVRLEILVASTDVASDEWRSK